MRISCFIVFGALLLSNVIAETEDPNRVEEVTTTKEPVTTHNVNSSQEQRFQEKVLQQPQDSDKPRNVRATKRIFSSPFSSENPWEIVESFDKTSTFFEHSLQDQEKSKLVIVEPFFRVKKVEKGFWGWLKKIFGENKEKKGQGPLIGPIKVPGMGEHVYIRAVEPLENESERVVIHLVTRDPPLGSSEKEIKLANPLPLGSSIGSSFSSFDTVHELPIESSSFQTIFSPHFSSAEVGGLFDKSHFSASDASWSPFSSPPIRFPSEKEDIFSSPSFFRKHSTQAETSEFSASLPKDAESSQQYTAWAQPYEYSSPSKSYGDIQPDYDHQGLFASTDNQEFSSAREDIDKVQGTQSSQLELSEGKESLPLYPPLFNASFSHTESNDKEQVYDKNGRESENLDYSSGSTRYSGQHPGLGAYQTQSQITILPNTNNSDEKLEEKYILRDGIREVEAPNLYQAENGGMNQYSESNSGEMGSDQESKSSTSNVENSKKVRNSQSWDYGNYGVGSEKPQNISTREDSTSKTNETNEAMMKIFASYPWTYRVSKGRFVIPKKEEDREKKSMESPSSNPQVQTQSESRKPNLQRHRSRFTLDGGSKKDVKNKVRSRNRVKTENQGSEIQNLENKSLEEQKTDNRKTDLEGDTSKAISETDLHVYKNYSSVLKTEGEPIMEDGKKCPEEGSKCTEEKKDPMTAEEVKQFFVKESKRFEHVLKTVEEESKAIREESKFVEEEMKSVKEESKPLEEELSVKKYSKSVKENKSSDIENASTESTKTENQKIYIVTPETPFSNRSRFDIKSKKSPKEEVKKSNSTVKIEFRGPILHTSRVPIMEGRFKSNLKNNTNLAKSNSTLKMENPKTTPLTHISRIYAKNRSSDKLKNSAQKEGKSGTEENQKSEEESKKSPDTMSKVEKQKEELHVRMSKLFPKVRNNKPKIDTEVTKVKDENEIKANQTQEA